MKQKLLVIGGPTAVGKTDLSIRIAKKLNGEIISADSMQIYKYMDIGSAKVTKEEMDGIFHYLIDIQEYDQPYNVMIFQDVCRKSIQKIQNKNKQVILCGGTGLYLKAALYDYTFEEETQDEDYLKELNQKSNEELYELLKEIDEKSLEKIHKNNRKRILRALMMAHSGMSKSQREQQQKHIPLYDIYYIGLDVDRNILHQRINDRVDKMFEQGLVEEVTSLFKEEKTWEYTSFQGIGYKEFKDYFLDQITLEETKERIKTHSRQYAKRQYTWFKNQMPVHWYSIDQKEQILKDVKQWLKGEI